MVINNPHTVYSGVKEGIILLNSKGNDIGLVCRKAAKKASLTFNCPGYAANSINAEAKIKVEFNDLRNYNLSFDFPNTDSVPDLMAPPELNKIYIDKEYLILSGSYRPLAMNVVDDIFTFDIIININEDKLFSEYLTKTLPKVPALRGKIHVLNNSNIYY